jgi:hypothetical protein
MFEASVRRRNLTPPKPMPVAELHGTRRRSGGARHEASDRVVLRRPGGEVEGWTLNVSRGGVRVILEAPVELGHEYEIVIGDDEQGRRCRVVWVQDEADGQIAGVQFLDIQATPPPPPGAP